MLETNNTLSFIIICYLLLITFTPIPFTISFQSINRCNLLDNVFLFSIKDQRKKSCFHFSREQREGASCHESSKQERDAKSSNGKRETPQPTPFERKSVKEEERDERIRSCLCCLYFCTPFPTSFRVPASPSF